jgi:drug/metabolite transporter (DMT)-like permease
LFSLYHWKEVSADLKKVSRTDYAWLAFTSIVTGFIANFLYYLILEKHESYIIAALIYSSPVFTLLLLYLFWGGAITKLGALGVFCTTMGIICISLSEPKGTNEPPSVYM